jgi:hypothetical protein
MNNRCQLQRGFFSLRNCGQTATQICTGCARSVCTNHLSPQAEFLRCVECVAREAQDDTSSSADSTTSYDNDWTYAQRSHYHSTYSHSHYDDSDYESFSSTGNDDMQAEADDPEMDFSDS